MTKPAWMAVHTHTLKKKKLDINSGQSVGWLFLSTFARLSWNLECWFFAEGGNWRTYRKPLGTRMRANNKLNPHVTPGPGSEPSSQWWEGWEGSTLTTTPSLLPQLKPKSFN